MSRRVDSSIALARLFEDKRTASADACFVITAGTAARPPAS